MMVIFTKGEDPTQKAMYCSYDDQTEQSEMMHRLDIDDQVKEWQQTNSGNPPKFYSRITIKEFTNRRLNFSNI